MPAGRPLKFQSIEEMQEKIDAYFESCYRPVYQEGKIVRDEEGKPILEQFEPFTVTGLALALGTSRETLIEIETQRSGYSDDFVDAITRAKLRCQNYAEKQLFLARSANGPIFALKNYGWTDRQDIHAHVEHSFELLLADAEDDTD